MKELENKFASIKKMGWIKNNYKGKGCAGNIFEELIGKQPDQFCYPDYNGIEIKTKKENSQYPITLFTCMPDGSMPLECERLRLKYGYPSKVDKNILVFNIKANSVNFTKSGYYKRFKLVMDDKTKRIYLLCNDIRNSEIDKETYWDYSTIEDIMQRKFSYLSLVIVTQKKENDILYFKYNMLIFYKYKGFDSFMRQMKEGNIEIKFNIDVFTNDKYYGKIHNHGVAFIIKEEYLNEIFEIIKVVK